MASTFRVVLTKAATKDMNDIVTYISRALTAPSSAEELGARIRKQIMSLDSFPERFPLSRDETLADKAYRVMPIENYVVLYLIQNDYQRVIVTRIFYGRMNYAGIL